MMDSIYWAALGIGGTTLIGTGCGFLFSGVTPRWNDIVVAFAAGVMLAAAMFGLFAPAMEMLGGAGTLLLAAGALCGMLFLRAMEAASARLGGAGGILRRQPELMFVLAIAIHKFPEGMAGGVGLNGMDSAAAATVVMGIALQNLPEGVVMIPPLLSAGIRRGRAALIALATGLLNAAGVFAGALWGRAAAGLLPFALAFAGGAMLDVIVNQMIPQARREGGLRHDGEIVMGGFLLMCCANVLF